MVDSKQAKVICFSNHKGGEGKTCSTCNIGAGLSLLNKRILLVDIDPQANLSMSFGWKDTEKSIYGLLSGHSPVQEVIFNITENLDLIPSNLDLAGAELELASEKNREFILKNGLSFLLSKYDYILIDCPPSLGLLTINALVASNNVVIPLQPQYLSLQGITKLLQVIEKVQDNLNPDLIVGGVLITQFDNRKALNRDLAEAIEKYFGNAVFKTKIRDTTALAECTGHHKDIFRYNKKSNGALDYGAVCKEILSR